MPISINGMKSFTSFEDFEQYIKDKDCDGREEELKTFRKKLMNKKNGKKFASEKVRTGERWTEDYSPSIKLKTYFNFHYSHTMECIMKGYYPMGKNGQYCDCFNAGELGSRWIDSNFMGRTIRYSIYSKKYDHEGDANVSKDEFWGNADWVICQEQSAFVDHYGKDCMEGRCGHGEPMEHLDESDSDSDIDEEVLGEVLSHLHIDTEK